MNDWGERSDGDRKATECSATRRTTHIEHVTVDERKAAPATC